MADEHDDISLFIKAKEAAWIIIVASNFLSATEPLLKITNVSLLLFSLGAYITLLGSQNVMQAVFCTAGGQG